MLPKGHRRTNGTYQYIYPKPAETRAKDARTNEMIEPITKATVVIEPSLDMYKYMQKYPFREKRWHEWYGLRSVVEAQNNFLKRPTKTDLAQAMNRLTRGVTFASIASTLAMVAANVRKIVTFVKNLAARTKISPRTPIRCIRTGRPRQRLPALQHHRRNSRSAPPSAVVDRDDNLSNTAAIPLPENGANAHSTPSEPYAR